MYGLSAIKKKWPLCRRGSRCGEVAVNRCSTLRELKYTLLRWGKMVTDHVTRGDLMNGFLRWPNENKEADLARFAHE